MKKASIFLMLIALGVMLIGAPDNGAAQIGPELSMPDLGDNIPEGDVVNAGDSVNVPVTYTANGNDIAAIVFSVDFDQANLIFDDTNTTGLPFPDSITVNPSLNPFIFTINVTYNAGDTDGELDFTFADFTQPFTALPEGDLATITFTAGPNNALAPVVFSQSPPASFGNTAGDSVAGTVVDGFVSITGGAECGNGIPETGEDCDDGAANGTTTCGCQTDCTLPTAGTSCADGEFCNGDETCDGTGNCQAGTPVVCDDGVGCTDDSCDENADVCVFAVNDGNCDDGQFCDGTETCDPVNDCQAGTPVDCSDGVGCTDDSCDEGNDTCINTPNDGNCPDDGEFCTGAEFCDPVNDCSATGDPCLPGETCDENQDMCIPPAECGDGNVDPATEDCDDGAANGTTTCGCQTDCTLPTAGTSCADGEFCNGDETCDGTGNCQAGTPVVCDDGVGCTDDSCDENADVCVFAVNDGNCDDGQFCDGTETCDPVNDCQAGTPVDCSDGVGCTDDSCDEGNDTCINTPNDGNCPDDGEFCTGAEFCDPVNDCSATGDPCLPGETCDENQDMCIPPAECGDGNVDPATEDCDDGAANGTTTCGCQTDCTYAAQGTSCTDGEFCNGDETCDGNGQCQAGTPPSVDDGVGCTDDSCDEVNDTIVNIPNDGNCADDGQFCTGAETCDPVNDCSSTGNPCLPGETCDESQDRCIPPVLCGNGNVDPGEDCDDGAANGTTTCGCQTDCSYAAQGTSCADGEFCNGDETCDGNGQCQAGTPPSVDDGVGCTDDSCDEVNDTIVNIPNDGNCADDGQFCTGAETCDPVNDCSSTGDPCLPGETCDESQDRCIPPVLCGNGNVDPGEDCDDGAANGTTTCGCQTDCTYTPANTACDDGLFCNEGETCDGAGSCGGGSPLDCGDGVSCTVDSCNEGTDSCDNVADDGLCDNGQFCDGTETCDPVNDCQAGTDPCPGQTCDESQDICIPDCVPTNVPETVCNGIDDNCNGEIDEDYTSRPTTCGAGECASTGQTICVEGVEEDTCTPGIPSAEVCDNLDNDCDGSIDNGFNVGMSCTVGVGACKNTGMFVCTIDGTGTRCNVSPLPPGTEGPVIDPTCEDLIDNDCDGFIDTDDSDCVMVMGGEGCSTGYWKKEDHFDSWSGYTPDTLFSDVFDDAFPGMTLLDVLRMKGGKLNSLGRQTVAALLNADSPDVSYDLAEMEVIMMFNRVFPGTQSEYGRLKELFEGYNEQDCTLHGMRDEDEENG